MYWHGSGGNRVSTRILAAGYSRGQAKDIRKRIYQKMMFIPYTLKFGNKRHFHFIPFSTTATLSDDAIRNRIMLHNQHLLDISAVTVKYLNNRCWKVPGTAMKFLEVVLSAEDGADPPNKLFNNVKSQQDTVKCF